MTAPHATFNAGYIAQVRSSKVIQLHTLVESYRRPSKCILIGRCILADISGFSSAYHFSIPSPFPHYDMPSIAS